MSAADAHSLDRRRAATIIASLYGFGAAAVGLWLLAGAALQLVVASLQLALDLRLESTWPDPLPSLAVALASAALAGVVVRWHLRHALRRMRQRALEARWARSLYLHLVALVALVAALIGVVELMSSVLDLLFPQCISAGTTDFVPGRSCIPPPTVAARNAIEGVAVLFVATPVFAWHVSEASGGRQLRLSAAGRWLS